MSKKIISAILVMAMVISMSATALLSSVGAAAETDYEADRTTLGDLIKYFVTYGPTLETETYDYLKTLGLIKFNGDLNCDDGCGEYVELHNRNSFWEDYTETYSIDQYLFAGEGDDFAKAFVNNFDVAKIKAANGKVTWDKTRDEAATSTATAKVYSETWADMAKANISAVVEYAASVWYFGQDANNALVDPSFNEGRNKVVKDATGMLNNILAALKKEVAADVKPVAYDAMFKGEYYKGFATEAKAYNQSIGFNPYLYIVTEDDYTNDNYWTNGLGQYTVRWYTFAEAREIDAEGVFAFENAIRKVAMNNGAEVLFVDFVGEEGAYTEFTTIVEDLFVNLVGEVDKFFVEVDVDDQIKAFLKLNIIIDIYDLYIKDVYNNIYTASAAELLNDVLYAKRIIDYVNEADNKNAQLLILALSDFEALTADVLSGIAAVAPRSEQLLKAADITEGTALVRKAEALLANWSNWTGIDGYKDVWANLSKAKDNLKNMIPSAEGKSVLLIVEAAGKFNGAEYKLKNFADTEIKNDRVIVEFAPNWFSYVKFYALLEAQIEAFTKALTEKDASISADLGKNDNGALVDAINKYGYLVGIVGKIVELADYTKDGKDNKTIELVPTTVWTKYDADPDKGVYKEDTGKATAQFIATEKYAGYLFDTNAEEVEGFDRTNSALPSFAYVNADPDSTTTISKWSDTYDAATTCYVSEHYDNGYNQVIAGIVNYRYLSNINVTDDEEVNKLDSIYEAVLGYVAGNNTENSWINQDAALDNVYYLMETILGVVNYALDEENYKFEASFDWVKEEYTTVSGHAAEIAKIEAAVKTLTYDITKEIQGFAYILAQIAWQFGWEFDFLGITENGEVQEILSSLKDTIGADNYNKLIGLLEGILGGNNNENPANDGDGCYRNSANYPDGFMDAARDAANELYDLITVFVMSNEIGELIDQLDEDLVKELLNAFFNNGINGVKGEILNNAEAFNVAKRATRTSLKAAYENFITEVKAKLLTEEGAAKLDKFIADVNYIIGANLAKNEAYYDWNEYDMRLQKLLNSEVRIWNYFNESVNCFQYYALTLRHVADHEYFNNIYFGESGALSVNLKDNLDALVANTGVAGYTRDWAEKFNSIRTIAAYVSNAIVVDWNKDADNNRTTVKNVAINSDMPVWYAERVLKELNAAWADRENYTLEKLVEYKAGLEALLIEADGLNVYNYVSDTDEAKAIWADFVEAYANAQYIALDTRCEFAKVDEAVAALTAAMAELEKIEAADGASTVDTLNAKIAAAEALLARADVVELAEEAELVLAINAAKKALQFNTSVLNSTDLDAQIKAIDDIMNAIVKEMYTGADLKKAAKVLELQVVVDLYTEASYRKFANALEAAYAMAEEDTATESAMMAAAANVEARFGDLKLAPVEEEPEVVEPEVSVVMTEAIEIYNNAANGYDKAVEGCTAESAAAYNAAINTLKADIEANADDAKLLESIIALNLAKAALTVDVPETCDC